MRVAFVVGFNDPVLGVLSQEFSAQLQDQLILWVGAWSPHGDGDLVQFTSLFLDRLAVGATNVLVLSVVRRGREEFGANLRAIIYSGETRFPKADVQVVQFKNAREAPAVVQAIRHFLGIPQECEEPPSYPDSLDDLEGWCEGELDSRVIVLPRAIGAARKSRFVDIPLIYKSLLLLGNEYRDVRMDGGNENLRKYKAKLAELGVAISKSISESRAGEQGNEYYVAYPSESDKRLLEYHVRKGAIKDERYCLRIYFFWDAKSEKVVIGWLPSHLETRGT